MKITVDKDNVKIEEFDIVHEGEHRVNKCSFSFSEEYTEELVKKAIFTSQNSSVEVAIINNECNIPTEILRARNIVLLGVYAYKVTEDKLDLRYSPSPDAFKVNSGSYIEGASESEEITPSQFEQYMQALNDGLNKVEESLAEMDEATSSATNLVDEINQKLENGDFIGPEGPQGIPGNDGVGITTITTGQSTVEEDKTITPITVNKTDGSSQIFNVEAKNGIDGQNGQDGTNGQDGLTPTIGDNGNWYLGDTDTGKPSRGEVGPSPDLSNYVQFDDYATTNKTGVIRLSNGMTIDPANGNVFCVTNTNDNYKNAGKGTFISKGTLENIKDDYVGSSQPVQDLTATVTNVQNDQDEGMPKQTASGEMITVDDAIAYKIFNVTVDGASEQITTTGKNLLPYPYPNSSETNAGITFTVNDDGTVTVDGTSTAFVSFQIYGSVLIGGGVNIPGNYVSGGTDKVQVGVFRNNGDNTYSELANNKGGFTEIDKSSYTDGYVEIRINPGITVNNEIIRPMLSNEQNIDWEPYTGGHSSPSPDYPQEITTLTFDKITRCGKNLYNVTDIATYYINAVGEDVSVDEEGWITIDVDNSQSSSEKFNNYWTKFSNSLKPNTKYNIFLEIKEIDGNSGYISVTNETYNSQFNNAFSLNLKDISGNSIKNQICITKQNHMEENMTMLRTFLSTPANSKNKITFRISVIEDVTVTPQNFVYEPYQATEYAIDLQGNEFVEISKSIKDNLVIDKYGNVSLIKNVNKKILNGSEDWIYDNQEGDIIQWKVYLGDNKYSNDNEIRCMSDYFMGFGFNDSWYTNNTICLVEGKSMRINTNRFQTVEELKVWLQEHNVTVYYQLATPQTIPLGTLSELITTLNGTNNISINGNIPTTISTTYALDIKKYIDNKLAEVSSALIEEG